MALAPFASATGTIYGLALTQNGPGRMSLSRIDTTTGNVTIFPTKFSQEDGMGDLNAADESAGIYYYLGDTPAGTTLVGIDMKTGTQACSGTIPLIEHGFVGLAQSLDYDSKNKNLVLTGLAGNGELHGVLRTKGCENGKVAPTVHVGTFGDAQFLPMLHAATLDSEGQRLYVEVATSKTSVAIGVVNLNAQAGSKDFFTIVANEDTSHSLTGMQWDSKKNNLVGVVGVQPAGLSVRTLTVDYSTGNATWTTKTLPPQDYERLYGNEGDVSALDTEGRYLYVLAGKNENGRLSPMHLVQIDLKTDAVTSAPLVTGLPLGADTLFDMLFVSK
eukprot:gene18094-5724_t